jgi:hypothetical protein
MKPTYRYFMTFTKKPDIGKDEVFKNLEKFIARSDVLEITKLWYVLEHWQDDSNPHIHCYIEANRTLSHSRYKHYENVGKIDRKKAKGTLSQIEDYMSKEGEIVKVI